MHVFISYFSFQFTFLLTHTKDTTTLVQRNWSVLLLFFPGIVLSIHGCFCVSAESFSLCLAANLNVCQKLKKSHIHQEHQGSLNGLGVNSVLFAGWMLSGNAPWDCCISLRAQARKLELESQTTLSFVTDLGTHLLWQKYSLGHLENVVSNLSLETHKNIFFVSKC